MYFFLENFNKNWKNYPNNYKKRFFFIQFFFIFPKKNKKVKKKIMVISFDPLSKIFMFIHGRLECGR